MAYNKIKHCHRLNGPRLLSLKRELSLQLKRIRIPVSALLAFLHSFVTTFSTLCTSMSSYSSITTSPAQWPNNIYYRQIDTRSNISCNEMTTISSKLPFWHHHLVLSRYYRYYRCYHINKVSTKGFS